MSVGCVSEKLFCPFSDWVIGFVFVEPYELFGDRGTVRIMSLSGIGASSGFAVGAVEWNVTTMPEYLSLRFGSRRIQSLLAVLFLYFCIFHNILVELFIGTMAIKLVAGVDVSLTAIILLTVTGIHAFTGGFMAVVFIDAIYSGILLLGSILLTAFDKDRNSYCVSPAKCGWGAWWPRSC
ncbi:PREDICTED: sodium/glucose cotransporter 1-like [Condylura cristata]|uniref:sodium/glucose cotransporter 1-like n=1 Tax=Condylura cristata TaxID=143302 RepID=UPI000642B59C|nr:PREDICTED: sodium/glucose cotransporter 1-like [Condylura cristata]